MIHYAGIGSREMPPNVFQAIKDLAKMLCINGLVLRSGGAKKGADKAFEQGADDVVRRAKNNLVMLDTATMKEIMLPWDTTEKAREEAAKHHPGWHHCSRHARRCHGRNTQIVLGRELDSPVNFVACWTKNEHYGGTSQGIRVARAYRIPVVNLAKIPVEQWLEECLKWV